jgi:CYTH domain-containing protein
MANHDVEIERKYLLTALPPEAVTAPQVEIDQGYLPGERILERIRRVRSADGPGENVQYFRTVKLGKGVQRFEFEEETTELFFITVWPLTRGRRVQKRRYTILVDGVEWVVDEFVDRALVLAEIELDAADAAVQLPPWLTAVLDREVTDESDYTNFRLAR